MWPRPSPQPAVNHPVSFQAAELGGWQAAGGPAHAHLPRQEEIRVDSTIVFVDPYEEADAQVRKGLGGRLCPRPAQFCPRSPTWASA